MEQKAASRMLQLICEHFHVEDVYALNDLHLEYDQKLIKTNGFDPSDDSLINNQIKDALVEIPLNALPNEQRKVVQGILWLWHHHAATVALWRDKNPPHALEYCTQALTYQYPGHPNKITRMLHLLLLGEITAARRWAQEEVGENEREYADHLLEEYEKGIFKNKPPTQGRAGGSSSLR